MKTKMKSIIFTAIIILYSVDVSAQKKWTLSECIERAINKNISIKQSKADLKSTSLTKTTAIANFLPSINLGSSHSWNVGLNQNITTGLLENMTTTSASLSANVGIDLFNGLQNIQQLYRANLSILASQYQLADMTENISLLVANSYLQILFNRESLGVQYSQLTIANEELIIVQERLKTGIIPKGDVLEIEANVATIEQNVVVAENNYQLSKISLAQLLLISEIDNFEVAQETAITPKPTILNTNVNTIYLTAVAKRNDVKLAETNLKIANTATDGDSRIEFQVANQTLWSLGVEDGDSDKFVLNWGSGVLGAAPAFEVTNHSNNSNCAKKSKCTFI